MDSDEGADRIEGYLYSFGPSRAGSIYCVLTFCVLSGRRFAQLRHKGDLVSLRSGVLDANHRVEDTGRQLVNGKVLYTIRLYSTSDYSKEVLLGAVSAEEAAEWTKAFIFALAKPLFCNPESWPIAGSSNMTGTRTTLILANRQPESTQRTNGKVFPVSEWEVPLLSPPQSVLPKWKLVFCENGLRFFEEAGSISKVPVMKAVGVVKGQSEHIFDEIMNYGPERFQWDHTIDTASILEVIDGHSDIVHICLKQNWTWLRPRDFCLSRYWKREDNGSYTIFYRSVLRHPVKPGYVRAKMHSGGFIITPLNTSGKAKSLVESVFEIDIGGWSFLHLSSYSLHLRKSFLSVIAGMREYFTAQRLDTSVSDVKHMVQAVNGSSTTPLNLPPSISCTPFLDADQAEDFFDARADQLSDASEDDRNMEYSRHVHGLEKEVLLSKLKGSLSKGSLSNSRNTYSEPDCTIFKIRSASGRVVTAQEPFFQVVAVDWYKSQVRLDNISSRRSIVQTESKDLFFFTFNLQVPHSGCYYNLIFYFASDKSKISEGSLVHRFINGDDEFRNQRLQLLPSIPEGSWVVRQAVGSRSVVLGQILECNYHRGDNYIEVDVNMGSSGIVRGVMGIVFGYISALVVDMGFSLQDNELTGELIAAVRCSRLDLSAAAAPIE